MRKYFIHYPRISFIKMVITQKIMPAQNTPSSICFTELVILSRDYVTVLCHVSYLSVNFVT